MKGVGHGFKARNLKIIIAISIAVLILSQILSLTGSEQLILLVAILAVIGAEFFNTAIEELADVVTLEHHEGIARTKELAAAAVLAIGGAAIIMTLYIFIPHLNF